MNILIVAQDSPLPLNYAAPIDMFNRISALKSLGHNVHLICTVKELPNSETTNNLRDVCMSVTYALRKYGLGLIASNQPFQIISRTIDSNVIDLGSLRNIDIGAIIADGYCTVNIAKYVAKQLNNPPIFLRVHNNESSYLFQLAKSSRSLIKFIYYTLEAIKYWFYERNDMFVFKYRSLLHISYRELQIYQKKYPHQTHVFLPAGLDIYSITPYRRKHNKSVIFVGSLFMPNNIYGLIWYLKYCHPAVLHACPDVKLTIAGNVRVAIDPHLMKIVSKLRNVEIISSPITLDDLYNSATVFINPMLHGAGVKLKSLNAICSGLPVVSTIVGNEGTGLLHNEHLLVSDDPNVFASYVVKLLENEQLRAAIVQNAQNYLKVHYNSARVLQEVILS